MSYVYFKAYFLYSEHKNDKKGTNHDMPFIVIMSINFYYNIFSYLIGILDVSTNSNLKAFFNQLTVFVNCLHNMFFRGSLKPTR